jgi:putative methionine-R-sulfoxide reductase with GAF domain
VQFPGEDGGRSLAKMAQSDLDAALQLLAERAQYITGATGAAIALRDGEEMVCRASAGGSAPEIGARLQMDSGLSGESIRTRQMLRCDDAQTDGRVNKESCEALGIASVVVMPMVEGGMVIGVFELFSDRAHAFEERDILALERMGAMVRTALEQGEGAEARIESGGRPEAAEESDSAVLELADAHLVEESEAGECQAEEPSDADDVLEMAPAEGGRELLSVPAVNEEETLKAEIRKAMEVEPDVGDLARDAAAKTAAFKASLFEKDAPPASAPAAGKDRIAFHTRVPAAKRPDATAVVAADVAATQASAAETNEAPWETPRIEDARPTPAMSAKPEVAATKAAAEKPSVVATSGASAAAAPARAEEKGKATPVAKTADVSPGNALAQPTGTPEAAKQSGVGTPSGIEKSKAEVARPASAEGRLRIAISQVRKCESCGFPVSEGRKLCLDCEKKKPKEALTSAKKEVAVEAPAPTAVPAATSGDTLKTEPMVETKAPVQVPTAIPAISEAAQLESPTVETEKPESDKVEAVTVPGIEEGPMPQFMVGSPDQHESWIVAHKYSAIAIAVIVVGIIVYLLSR